MRVLIVNQFYPPDVAPTGRYAHDLACFLVRRGHEVTALCSRGAYDGGRKYAARELLDGVAVRRVWSPAFSRGRPGSRLAGYLGFCASVVPALLTIRPRPDVCVCLTTPPYLGAVVAMAAGLRRIPMAHWIMDLYPDVMVSHGMLREGSGMHRLLVMLARWHLRPARLAVTLSPEMARRLAVYTGDCPVEWVPLWSRPDLLDRADTGATALRAERGWRKDELVLMYSGNMGLGHRFGEFLEAVEATRQRENIRWAFAGGGPRRGEVERFIKDHPSCRVTLLGYAPGERLADHLLSADVLLVSLDSRWQGCILPSKIQEVFAVGRPVILVGGLESSLADWIREAGAGWVVAEGDVAGLLRAVEESRDIALRRTMGAAARVFARRTFAPASNCGRMAALLEDRARETGGTACLT